MDKLRPYQLEAIKEIMDKKRVLIADDMGMGKCAESIKAKIAIENNSGYGLKTLIVCPSSVMEHWESEIEKWYTRKDYVKVARIQTSTYDADVKNTNDADFTIMGYSTLSELGKDEFRMDQLKDQGFNYGIIDEGHNAKNPKSFRSRGAKNLFDSMDYLAILTGTPLPNTIVDIYMLLSLLDKDSFPINPENPRAVLRSFYNSFREDPEFVRRILNDRMLRRTIDDYLDGSVPELKKHTLNVTLKGEHKEAYLQVYRNYNIRPGTKLIRLRQAALDPNLVPGELLSPELSSRKGRLESSVYNSLDDLLEERIDSGGKALIFSNFKKGVTDKLKERYEKYGTLVIDGDVTTNRYGGNISAREECRRKFQKDPNSKVLIATTVMDEGVDLTAATDIIRLGLPYTPAAFDQGNRRSQRIGEVDKDNVNVYTIRTELQNNLTPTIDEGIERLLEDKRRIITYLLKEPFSLTKSDLDEIKNGKVSKSKHLEPAIDNAGEFLKKNFGRLKTLGGEETLKILENYPMIAWNIARLYAENWEGYYGGNTANLYTKIIKIMEDQDDLSKKVDIASGPFSLSRKLEEPVVNIDLSESMLKAGRLLEERGDIVKGNIAYQGLFGDLNMLKDGEFDLAVCSLALHFSKLTPSKGEEFGERELAFREQNRILRDGGYSIITLPSTRIQKKEFSTFNTGLNKLGFEVLPFSGFYKGPKDTKFKVYLAGLKKVSEPQTDPVDPNLLSWKIDLKNTKTGTSTNERKNYSKKSKVTEKEFVNEFSLIGKSGLTLEEVVKEAI